MGAGAFRAHAFRSDSRFSVSDGDDSGSGLGFSCTLY